jgi:protein-S-isoprenylcysteine O-methyltransferase
MRKSLPDFLLTFLIPLLYLAGPVIISSKKALFSPSLACQLSGLFLAVLGLVFWFGGYFSLGLANFSVLPPPKTFQKRGLYAISAHPVYLGIFLTYFGLSLATGSKLGLSYTFGLILPLNLIRAQLEEKELRKQFGQAYQEYKKKTFL